MQEIIKKAIEVYGSDAQIELAIEEMSELTKALIKMNRFKRSKNGNATLRRINIAEEIADVEIMLAQLKIIYDCNQIVNSIKDLKIERLEKKMQMKEFYDRVEQ